MAATSKLPAHVHPVQAVYQAPLVAGAICLMIVLRWTARKLERSGRVRRVPWFLQYYTWLYLFLVYLMSVALAMFLTRVMFPTHWLDPDATERFVREVLRRDGEPAADLGRWRAEASLEGYAVLRMFALLSPVWTLGCLLVCMYHTSLHVRAINRKSRLVDSPWHDKTILILALPMFYGLMSLQSVVRAMQVCIDHVGYLTGPEAAHIFKDFTERKDFVFQMYDSNFMVADLYETYALVTLGELITSVLEAKIEETIEESHSHNPSDQLLKAVRDLQYATRNLTMGGVRLFNYACLAQAVYAIFITAMGFYGVCPSLFGPDVGLFQTWKVRNRVHSIFMGAGIVASTAAIGNLMEVEHKFEHFLIDFRPAAKFWGTKILVTLAFLQSLAMMVVPPFSSLTETRSNLLYSSLLCLECFLLSLLHMAAWRADEPWYSDSKGGLQEELLPPRAPEA